MAEATEACCREAATTAESCCCPSSGTAGQPVRWTTVAALSTAALPRRQEAWLCPDPDCEVVYFGDRGLEIRLDGVRAVPGFKASGEIACYCFHHSREALELEARAEGRSPTVDAIRARVRDGDCACEVRNPSGRCCLPDLEALVERAAKGVA